MEATEVTWVQIMSKSLYPVIGIVVVYLQVGNLLDFDACGRARVRARVSQTRAWGTMPMATA